MASLVVKIHFSDDLVVEANASTTLKDVGFDSALSDNIETVNGNIISNELTFVLDNAEGLFTPESDSPYSEYIKEGVKIELFDDLAPLGTYFVSSWEAPLNAYRTIATIKGVDRLMGILNTPVSIIGIYKGLKLKNYLKLVFNSVGVPDEDLIIDESLTQVLNYSSANDKVLADVLNLCCISGFCNIYVNRENKIVVRSRESNEGVTHNFSDSTNIVSVELSKSLLNSSNCVRLNYSSASIGDASELVSLKKYDVQNGDVVIENLSFGNLSAYDIDHINVKAEGFKAFITGYSCNQNNISLTLNVSEIPDIEEKIEGEEEPVLKAGTKPVDISVFGRCISSATASVERTIDASILEGSRKELVIDSPFTQSLEDATALCDKFWSVVNYSVPFIKLETLLDDFSIKLGDFANISVPIRKLNFFGYIFNISYEWHGGTGVSCTVGVKYKKRTQEPEY